MPQHPNRAVTARQLGSSVQSPNAFAFAGQAALVCRCWIDTANLGFAAAKFDQAPANLHLAV